MKRVAVLTVGLLVAVPAAAALVLALVFARNALRALAVALVGLPLAGVLFAVSFLTAPRQPDGCSDCSLVLGRYWEPMLVVFLLAFGLAGWLAGTLVGTVLRRLALPPGEARSDAA